MSAPKPVGFIRADEVRDDRWFAAVHESVLDPSRTFGGHFCCAAQQP
jgi:hypothetical protein